MLTDYTDALVGTMLGKDYRVIEPIGMGGMAVVYLVEHQTLLKKFAAKVLSPALASSMEARARFTQEAHSASQLDHENIVSISDFGVTADHRPFFVMELLRGQTLDERLSGGPMSLEEVVAVAVPVARALAHAHAEGIVHLDVKPENIFLVQRSQGRWGVKVVDFGIAKTPLNPRLAKPDETAGSPLFMAPEVCRGDDDVDRRADIYSFGILLYLMLCGRLPFVADSAHRVLQMQLVQLPAPPRELNAALSPELAAIVERCLAKDRRDRYPSMEALLRDFQAALPAGADRILIEAQSGTAAESTPFAAAMAFQESGRAQRASQPAPTVSATSAPLVRFEEPTVITGRPAAPRRSKRPILIVGSAIAATVIGVIAAQQLTSRSHATPKAPVAVAAAEPPRAPAPTAPPITPPAPQAAPAPSPGPSDDATAHAEAAAPAPTEAVAEADAPESAEARDVKPGHPTTIAKRPTTHPKATISRTPHPAPAVKRTAQADAALAVAVTEPAPVPAPVEPAPAPAPPVTPAPLTVAAPPAPIAVPAPPPAPGPGSLDATPEIANLDVKGAMSKAVVERSLRRALPQMRDCYRSAAKAGHETPAIKLTLSFEIDENSSTTGVHTGTGFGSLSSCVGDVVKQIRTTQASDTGTTPVTAVIRFQPS